MAIPDYRTEVANWQQVRRPKEKEGTGELAAVRIAVDNTLYRDSENAPRLRVDKFALIAEWEQVYADIEDVLVPCLQLDPWERALYLLRHTLLEGKEKATFAVLPLSKSLGFSEDKVRKALRSLHRKGALQIEDRSRIGHSLSLLLPSEIPGLERPAVEIDNIDIESVDFFTGRQYVTALLVRDDSKCFYCLKQLTLALCELEHIVPQAITFDNSYRNVVVACHSCNKSKGELSGPDFVRKLYRDGILNETELQQRLGAITAVQSGQLVPEILRS